jgi:N-acyl-D-aspartate/D-glutamate deacylase
MNKLMKLGAVLLLGGATYAFALTADEVKAHVMEGKAFCDEVGVAKCVEEIGKKGGKFDKGELYIWANDFDGVITAHPKKPLKGKNLLRYKDKAGNQLFKNFIDVVKADGKGWSDYVWAHPVTKKQTPKSSFVIGIGENQLIGAGYYKE